MNKTWESIKTIWHEISYPVLFLFVMGGIILNLYEPFPMALNAYLINGDSIPLILLFDMIGTLLCFAISGILLYLSAVKWAWFPFALATLFVLPKLTVLHLGMVEDAGVHFLTAYLILAGAVPGTYIGWLISRAAIENREEGDTPDK